MSAAMTPPDVGPDRLPNLPTPAPRTIRVAAKVSIVPSPDPTGDDSAPTPSPLVAGVTAVSVLVLGRPQLGRRVTRQRVPVREPVEVSRPPYDPQPVSRIGITRYRDGWHPLELSDPAEGWVD